MTTDLTPDERQLHDLIERSLADVRGDAHRFEAHAVARGRTIRRRRRIAAGGAAVAVVASVAAVVVPAVSGDSGAERGLDPARQSGHRHPTSTDPGPGESAPVGWWSMPAGEVHDRLLPLLPAGVTVERFELAPDDRAPGEPAESTGWLRTTLSTPTGDTGDLEILLYPPDPSSPDPSSPDTVGGQPTAEQRISCPAADGPDKSCTEIVDADGHHVGRLLTWTPGDLVVREATLAGDEGGVVYAATANSTDPKWGWGSSTSAAAPPLTLADLRAVVESATWTDWAPADGR